MARLTPFAQPESAERAVIDCGAKAGRSFAPERADETASVFDAAVAHIRDLQGSGHHVILGAWSDGSRDRLCGVLTDHGLKKPVAITRLTDVYALKRGTDAAPRIEAHSLDEADTLEQQGRDDACLEHDQIARKFFKRQLSREVYS